MDAGGLIAGRLWAVALRCVLALCMPWWLPAAQAAGAAVTQAQAQTIGHCVAQASARHTVNPQVLLAILRVESGLSPSAMRRNDNGSVDVGIAQINSVHFPTLRSYGVEPGRLLDPCVGIFVAAWHLRNQTLRYGNTWFAVGAYHSVTPVHNSTYQAKVYRELMRAGARPGSGAGQGFR